jgi:hypothetical protein
MIFHLLANTSINTGSERDLGGMLVGSMLLVAAIGLTWYLIRRYLEKHQPGYADPHELFSELCQAHHLSWQETSLLTRLADEHRLADPGRLFLEPERFEWVGLGDELRDQAGQLAALRDKLFAPAGETVAA